MPLIFAGVVTGRPACSCRCSRFCDIQLLPDGYQSPKSGPPLPVPNSPTWLPPCPRGETRSAPGGRGLHPGAAGRHHPGVCAAEAGAVPNEITAWGGSQKCGPLFVPSGKGSTMKNFDRQYRLSAGQAGAAGFEIGGGSRPLHISFSVEKVSLDILGPLRGHLQADLPDLRNDLIGKPAHHFRRGRSAVQENQRVLFIEAPEPADAPLTPSSWSVRC